jgi:hypothetical protein
VSLTALLTGYIAGDLRTPAGEPFYPGVVFALVGLILSIVVVRETHGHVRVEIGGGASGGN